MTCGECPWFRKPGGCTQDVVEHDEECGMRRAFRVLRDEYRLARKNEIEWMRKNVGEYLRWRGERACMALAHGLQIANLLALCPKCGGSGYGYGTGYPWAD